MGFISYIYTVLKACLYNILKTEVSIPVEIYVSQTNSKQTKMGHFNLCLSAVTFTTQVMFFIVNKSQIPRLVHELQYAAKLQVTMGF